MTQETGKREESKKTADLAAIDEGRIHPLDNPEQDLPLLGRKRNALAACRTSSSALLEQNGGAVLEEAGSAE